MCTELWLTKGQNNNPRIMKQYLLLGFGALAFVGATYAATTGAFFTSTASAQANVFTAGTLNLAIAKDSNGTAVNGWETSQSAPWNFSAMAPGGAPSVASVWLKNTGSIDGMHLGISAASTESVSGYEKQVRITSLTLDGSNLLQGGAGATIADYVAPTHCDITVSGTKLSTATQDTNNSGKVVCVAPGDYNATWESMPTIPVTQPMTIVSTQGPAVTTSVPFDITASNVTLRGFGISGASAAEGIVIHSGVHDVSIKDNHIHDIATSLTDNLNHQGIYLEGDSTAMFNFTFSGNVIENIGNAANNGSNQGIYAGDSAATGAITTVNVSNNIVTNVKSLKGAYGIMVNAGAGATGRPGVSGLIVTHNSVNNLSGGWAHAIALEGNTPNASVTLNDVHDLTSGSGDAVGVQVEQPNTSAANITINQNNLTPNVAIGINNNTGIDVNGQNNWWGDMNPADQVSANVNTVGFLGGPVAGLVNGIDQNHNGYADMQDLRLTPLVNAPISFAAGAEKKLTLGVQLDGPTTGNSFQGAGLTTTLTFTLGQQ